MYKLFPIVSFIIRNFYLPNPFGNFQNGVVINLIIEPILQGFTFAIVSLFYEKGSAPAWGSFLYLFFYSLHTTLLILCSMFSFTRMAMTTIAVLYFGILIGLKVVGNKLSMNSF